MYAAVERNAPFEQIQLQIRRYLKKYQLKFGGVAQLGEHLPCKQGVRSSILLISTISNSLTHLIHFFSALRIYIRGSVEENASCTQICLNTSSKLDDTEEKHILVVP